MNLNNLPEFIDLEQVSDGWIKNISFITESPMAPHTLTKALRANR